jgi:hypothetical protein
MGYSNVTILMYGVTLNPEQAKALVAAFGVEAEEALDDLGMVPKTDLEKIPKCDMFVYDAEIKSQGSDSRVDSNSYDPDYAEHVFGINCGDTYDFQRKGIKMVDLIRKIPERAKRNFNQYCLPVLVEAGIEIDPDMIIVNQVW